MQTTNNEQMVIEPNQSQDQTYQEKGKQLRRFIKDREKKDNSVLISDFLMQTEIHEATKFFKNYKNRILNIKLLCTKQIEKHEDKLKQCMNELKEKLCEHTRQQLSNPSMTEEQVAAYHKNSSPFKLCLPDSKPIFIRLKQISADKPINEKTIENIFREKKISQENYNCLTKIINRITSYISDTVNKYQYKIKILQTMENEIIKEYNIQNIETHEPTETSSDVNQSIQILSNYASSASEGSMSENDAFENTSHRHHPYNDASRQSDKNRTEKMRMTAEQSRQLKIRQEFEKYEKGQLYLEQKELLLQNINDLFGFMMIETISSYVKELICKSYVHIDFGTKMIRPKLNEQQKEIYKSKDDAEEKYNYLLSLIDDLSGENLKNAVYIIVARNKLTKMKKTVSKCNTIINCNLQMIENMIDQETKRQIEFNTQTQQNLTTEANEETNASTSNSSSVDNSKKKNHIDRYVENDPNFRFKESDDLHLENIKKYYNNAVMIQKYLKESTDKAKIILQNDDEYKGLLNTGEVFEKDTDSKLRMNKKEKQLEKERLKKQQENNGDEMQTEEMYDFEEEDQQFSKKIEIKTKTHKNKRSYGIKQFNNELDCMIPRLLEKKNYRIIKLERGMNVFSSKYLEKKLISLLASPQFNNTFRNHYIKSVSNSKNNDIKYFDTVSIKNKLPKKKRSNKTMGSKSNSHKRKVFTPRSITDASQLNQYIQGAIQNFN